MAWSATELLRLSQANHSPYFEVFHKFQLQLIALKCHCAVKGVVRCCGLQWVKLIFGGNDSEKSTSIEPSNDSSVDSNASVPSSDWRCEKWWESVQSDNQWIGQWCTDISILQGCSKHVGVWSWIVERMTCMNCLRQTLKDHTFM